MFCILLTDCICNARTRIKLFLRCISPAVDVQGSFPAQKQSEIRMKPLSVSAAWIDSQVFEGAEISVAD